VWIAATGLALIVVVSAATIVLTNRGQVDPRRSEFPNTMGCRGDPIDTDGGPPDPQAPEDALVKQITATQPGGQRLDLSIDFGHQVPPQKVIISPYNGKAIAAPGSLVYWFSLMGSSANFDRPSQHVRREWLGGKPHDLIDKKEFGEPLPQGADPDRNLLTADPTVNGDEIDVDLDLHDQPGLFGKGAIHVSR
jgi:hypothetical protein